MLDKKVSGLAAEVASQKAEQSTFDSPDQVIQQGADMIKDVVGKGLNELIDQEAGPATAILSAGGAGIAGMKLFKGILEDDSLGLDDGPEL